MKYKKKMMPKIIAGIALVAILIGILGTGVLVVISSLSPQQESQISQEELEEYINSLSGTTAEPSGDQVVTETEGVLNLEEENSQGIE